MALPTVSTTSVSFARPSIRIRSFESRPASFRLPSLSLASLLPGSAQHLPFHLVFRWCETSTVGVWGGKVPPPPPLLPAWTL